MNQDSQSRIYNTSFYKERHSATSTSLSIITEAFLQLLPKPPSSIIDIGCGTGTLLSILGEKCETSSIIGIEGPWLKQTQFQSKGALISLDLNQLRSKDHLGLKGFDLACCLEVVEHLNSESSVAIVDFLCSLSPCILFSAAPPGQGGKGHINEKPLSYWVSLFRSNGFIYSDCIRPLIWDNPNVLPWYKQNIVVFCKNGLAVKSPTCCPPIDIIHPDILNIHTSPSFSAGVHRSVQAVLKMLELK